MVKTIIKRIIVGVGIALCLMALKEGGLISSVSALEIKNATPTYILHVDNATGTIHAQNPPLQQTVSGYDTTFYSMETKVAGPFTSLKFGYSNSPLTSNDIKKNLDMSFLLLTSQMTSGFANPIRVYVADRDRRVMSCDVSSGFPIYQGLGYSTQLAYFSVVDCSNIALGTTNFDIFAIGDFNMPKGSYFGVSGVSIYPHNSDAQATIDAINNNTQATEDVNNTLNDSTTDDPTSDISNMSNKNASNGSITQLLTLPITLYQSILNSLGGSCSSFNLGSLLGTNITLPCINLQNILGSTLYGIIDVLISGLFILSFRKKMVDIFNHMTSLNDRGNELE